MTVTKITTCCYCGARAALVLRGKERHELCCSKCGAPLHTMKMLRAAPVSPTAPRPKPVRSELAKRRDDRNESHVPRPKKRRKTKSFGRKSFSKFWELIEDIVDEVFD
jgi:hypothetical protein